MAKLLLLSILASLALASVNNYTDGTNSSVSCDGSSASGIVDDIKSNNLNITTLVTVCQRVCYIALGSGNSDMAGPGIMISYLIQIALAFLFGPLLPLTIWLAKKRSFQPILRRVPLLERLLLSATQTSLFYSLSIGIAALVIYHHTPTVLEIMVLYPLLFLQTAILTSLGSTLILEAALKFEIPAHWAVFWLPIQLFQILVTIIFRTKYSYAPKIDTPIYHALSRACHVKYVPDQDRSLAENFTPAVKQSQSLSGTAIAGIVFGPVILLIIVALVLKTRKRLSSAVFEAMARWKTWLFLLYGAFSLGMFFPIIGGFVELKEARRNALGLSIGSTYDNGWGYGQTIAVLIWAPFLLGAIKKTFKHERKLRAGVAATSAIDMEERTADQDLMISNVMSTETPTRR